MVGNDEDGWLFYSSNDSRGISVGEYSSLDEFREQYNQREHKFNFSQEQRLSTTPEQDQQMKTKALELAGTTMEDVRSNNNFVTVRHPEERPYRIITNNCSHHVAAIAEAGGQRLTNSVIPRFQILVSPETNKQIQRNRIIRSILW